MSLSETSMTFTYNGIRSPTLCDKIYDAQSLSCYNSFNLHRVKNWEAWPAGLVHCARCHIFPLEICQQNDSCLPWEDCGAAVCSHVNSCLERCSVSGYGFDSFALFGGVGVLIFGFAALYIRWLGRILVETGLRFWAIMKLHFSHWIVACDVRVLDCKSMHRVAQQPWDMVGLTLSWIFYCLPDSAWTGGNQIGQTKGRRWFHSHSQTSLVVSLLSMSENVGSEGPAAAATAGRSQNKLGHGRSYFGSGIIWLGAKRQLPRFMKILLFCHQSLLCSFIQWCASTWVDPYCGNGMAMLYLAMMLAKILVNYFSTYNQSIPRPK